MLHRGLRYLRASKISLQTLLAIPLIVQVIGTVLIVDYFCYRSGQAAIEELVDQVVEDTNRRVVQTLDDYVHASETLVQGQRLAIQLGGMDWQNAALMEAYFVEQLQINPQVSGLMIVTEAKDFLAVGRLPAAPFAIQERNPSTGNLENYAADRQGKRLYLQDVVENYDPHVTPSGDSWYAEAQGQGAGFWRMAASGMLGQDPSMSMAYLLPFTDAAGNVQGVLGASFDLDHLGDLLRSVPSSEAGRAFILDDLGHLMATSTGEVPFRQDSLSGNTETSSPEQWQLTVQESQDPLTRAAALWHLEAQEGRSLKAQRVRLLEQTYFVQSLPFEVSPGLTWQVVVVVPEADLAGRIHANLRLALWVSGLVLLGGVGVSLWAARRLTRSLLRLTQTAQSMEAGALELPLPKSRIAEVSAVSHALHQMHQQVQQSLITLQDSEQKFATLLDSLPMGVGVLDGEGKMLLLNRMGHSIFQWGMVDNPLDSLEGYNIYLANTDQQYPPERRPVLRALQGETVYVDDLEVEVQGRRIPLEIKTAPVLNESGEIIYVINAFQDISDRRQAEADRVAAQTLGHELRLLEQVLDVILAGYWDWNIPEHQEYLSPGFKRMFGYEDHELPNTPDAWQSLIMPEDLPGVLACFDRHVQSHGEEPFYNEVRYRHKDGSTVWVMCSGRLIEWDAAGQPLRMVGCHVDISDRKHLELELQESKSRLQDILENAPVAIVTLRQLADRLWVATYRSSGCDRVFGYTVKELKDTPGLWLSRVVEEDRHYAITNDTSLDSLPYHRTVEYRFRHKNGDIRWISGVQSIRWDETLQCAIATLIESDITQSKRAELALQDSEVRYRTLLETSPVGIFRNDVTGRCIYANSILQDMTGLPLEDILGDGWNRNLHPEDQDSMAAAWSTFVEQSNLGQEVSYHHEHRYFAADGSERWGFVQAIPEYSLSGILIGFVGSTVDITDRKYAEKLLQDSEARYLSILQDQTELIKRCRPDGTILFVNDALCRYFGLTKEEVIGRRRYPSGMTLLNANVVHPDPQPSATSISSSDPMKQAGEDQDVLWFIPQFSNVSKIYPDDQSIVDDCLASLSPDQPVSTIEHRVVMNRGVRWMQWTNRAIYNEQGTLIELQAVGRDIHDRKLAEEQVRASEAALLEAQQVAQIGNWMFDPVTQTITWSQELYRMFGLDPSQPAPSYADYLQKIHPDDRPTLIRCVEQAIAHGIPYTLDYRAIQPDGSLRYHEGRGKIEQDAQGQATRLFGTALDITKRKLIEGALQASESRFRAIFEQAAVGINQADRTGRLVEANQYFCTLLGYSRDELLALTVQEITHPDDTVFYGRSAPRIFEGEVGAFTVEKRYLHKNGEWIWAEVTISAVRDAHGQPYCDLAIVVDIRDRKRLEQELKASQAQLSSILNSAEASISSFHYYDDQTWETLYHSPGCTVVFGYPLDDFPAEKWLSSILPDDAARVIPQLLQAIHDEQTTTVEYRYHHPDGRICWISDTVTSRREESISGWVVTLVGIDISDRKQAEVALEREVLRRKTLFEASIDGIVILDRAGHVLEANASFARMLGYSVDEVTSLSIMDFEAHWSPEDLGARAEAMEFCGTTFETLHRRHDGSTYPVEISANSVDWYGEPVHFCVCRDISDRKQMEAELVHSRDFRELIFNESSDALFLVDLDTILTTDCNQRAVELFEASCREDLIQMEGHRLQKRPFTESELVSLKQEIEQKGCWSLELEYITFQGREFWGDLSAKNITFGDQRFQLVRVADISDRKQAELALQRLHEELKTFLDYAPALISLFDHEGRYVRVNPAFAQALGRSESHIIGYTFEDLFPDAMVMVFRERLQQLIVSQAPLMVEDDVELGGEIRTFQSILFPVVRSGETNNYWAIATDITERKQMEQALQVQEQQFRGLFNSAVRFIGLLSSEGKFLDVNHTALQLCRETRQDLMGVSVWDGPWFAPYLESQAALREGVERASYGETAQVEILAIGIDQVERYVDVTFKPLLDPEGRVYQILAEGADISDRKRAEMHLQEARIAAETANQAKSRFLANMSHELRTPLNAVLGYAQILMRDPDLAHHYQEYIQTIFSSGHHLLSLINDVLDLAKVESGHMGIDLEAVNVPALLDSIYGLFRQETRTRGLALEIEADPKLPKSIITDGKRLKQVLINLLGNAIKFTPRGTITLRAIVGAAPSPSNLPMVALTFQVEDTGIGISPEDQQRIFEAFEQADAGRQLLGSTGLGLAISQQLVTLLGGHLQLCSEVGQGSTFQFTLVVERSGDISDGLILPPTITGLAPGQPPCRILVVDDQAVNRQFLDDALSHLGFEVYLAQNGQEAIAAWQMYQPDLILMDQRLPDFHGEQVTANIREWEAQNQRPATPIFMVSASSMDSDCSGAIAAGCNAFLEKPIQIPELLQSIAQHLDVEFTSEEAIALSDTAAITLTSEDLKVMPLKWITQLYEAATQCRNDRIDHLIAEIPDDYAVLKQALSNYNYNIQVDVIMDLSFACLKT